MPAYREKSLGECGGGCRNEWSSGLEAEPHEGGAMGRFVLPRRLSLQELSRSTTFYAFIGFFCFYLYTRIDTLTSNGVSNHLIEYTPAPYDVFSFGMLCSLFVIAISVRARAVCCEFVPLAVAATLLAISPLYAVVGMHFWEERARASWCCISGGCYLCSISLQAS